MDFESETFVIPILEAGARSGKSTDDPRAGIGIGEPGDPMYTLQSGKQHAIAFSSKDHGADACEDLSPTLRAGGHTGSHANAGVPPAIAFNLRGRDGGAMPEVSDVASVRSASGGSSRSYVAQSEVYPTLSANEGGTLTQIPPIQCAMGVRRLTPVECEKCQGFWPDYTAIEYRGKPAADGPRYKAIGNSMAVPVIAWIIERIESAALSDSSTTKGQDGPKGVGVEQSLPDAETKEEAA